MSGARRRGQHGGEDVQGVIRGRAQGLRQGDRAMLGLAGLAEGLGATVLHHRGTSSEGQLCGQCLEEARQEAGETGSVSPPSLPPSLPSVY